ncbi:MAG: HDOD domain-containing protein [Gammaproteobacteria bacterium]|nr:HDOD domain-containing protein [Gammaproteobacteria bacterium]
MPTDPETNLIENLTIPPRPEVLTLINRERQEEYPNIKKISDAIGQDVSLSAAVFQIINSPALRLSKTITSIHQAVNLLGIERVERVVTIVSMRQSVTGNLNLGRFWDSAAEVANLASQLTDKLTGVNVDDAYTLGLFHNCGIPLMMQAFDDYKNTLIEMNETDLYPVTQIEQKRYGITHTKLSYMLLKKWHMPMHIAKAAYFHLYRFSDLVSQNQLDGDALSLIAILKMAENISDSYRKSMRATENKNEWEQTKDDIFLFLGIDDHDYIEIKEDMLEWLDRNWDEQ